MVQRNTVTHSHRQDTVGSGRQIHGTLATSKPYSIQRAKHGIEAVSRPDTEVLRERMRDSKRKRGKERQMHGWSAKN